MDEKEWKQIIWTLVTLTFLVSAFALYYIYFLLTFDPPVDQTINLSQALE